MNLQDLINAAPEIKGTRKLSATEPAQAGDRFFYLFTLTSSGIDASELTPECLGEVDHQGTIQIGRTLEQSAQEWARFIPHAPFDGVIYRPTKSSV